jgi:ATP-grasp domain
MATPGLLFLFPDEWDYQRIAALRRQGRYRVHTAGFNLFRFPSNVQLFTYDVHSFVKRIVARYQSQPLAGIITSDEQFGPVAMALCAAQLGLAAPSLDAVTLAQHKYWSRVVTRDALPEVTPAFATLDRRMLDEGAVTLPYPFYIKPIKAAFSVLARKINSLEECRTHLTFAPFEEAIIRRLVHPFNVATRSTQLARFGEYIDAYTMICEELIQGHQVTCNGFVKDGQVTMLGTVDSIMYPGTDQFMRFQYPSRLPEAVLKRMDTLAQRMVASIGFNHGMFNVEMMWDPDSDSVRIIELNPRVAGQFFDLFELVDGYSLFEATLSLALNQTPLIRKRAGSLPHAASFVLRDFTHEGMRYVPDEREIDGLRKRFPEASLHVFRKTGGSLRRELKWLGSYRYCIINLGGHTLEDLFARFIRVRDAIAFHPRGYRERLARESLADLMTSHWLGGGYPASTTQRLSA